LIEFLQAVLSTADDNNTNIVGVAESIHYLPCEPDNGAATNASTIIQIILRTWI
jgi:hypothetical protein